MRKVLKWLGIFVVGMGFLLLSALGIAYYYKSDILEAINQELSRSINGEAHLRDITFSFWEESPGVSFTLHDFYIRDTLYKAHGRDFLRAKKVFVNVRLLPLLKKTIVVRSIAVTEGEIFVFRSKTGYTNADVLKKGDTVTDTVKSNNPVLVLFRRGKFEDIKFLLYDSMKQKSIGFHLVDLAIHVVQNDTSNTYHLKGPVLFDGLMFNGKKGSFLKDRPADVTWHLEFIPKSQQLFFHPSTMKFDKSTLDMSGEFGFAQPGKFIMRLSSDGLDFREGVSLLTQNLQEKLARYDVDQPLKINTTLMGKFSVAGDPAIDISFQFTDSKVKVQSVVVEHATGDGMFANHLGSDSTYDDHHSQITVKTLKGIFRNFPAELSGTLRDLIDPVVDAKATMKADLKDFKSLGDSMHVKFEAGKFDSEITYKGRLNELLDTTTTRYTGKFAGKVMITGGSLQYLPRKQVYENVSLEMNFDQYRAGIKDLSFTLNKSPLKIKGEITGLIPFFPQIKEKGFVKLDVYSSQLDMAAVMAKPTQPISKRVKPPGGPGVIDQLYQKTEFEVNLQLDKVTYQNLRGSNVKGKLTLIKNTLEGKNFKMNLAGGDIVFSLTLFNLQNPVNPVSIQSNIRHADIKKFFYSFNNFKQDAIGYENLEGSIDMNIWFRGRVDDDFNVFMPGMAADIDFLITNGRLINFEPLQNMSNFLFKKRDFTDVQFGEIKSHLKVRGSEFDIARMEVESSVLRLFIEGRYSMKGNTDMEVQVPLSNLKKRDKDYKPENVGVDSKVGPSVYLHIYKDENGKTAIAYDPFKKHARKSAAKK